MVQAQLVQHSLWPRLASTMDGPRRGITDTMSCIKGSRKIVGNWVHPLISMSRYMKNNKRKGVLRIVARLKTMFYPWQWMTLMRRRMTTMMILKLQENSLPLKKNLSGEKPPKQASSDASVFSWWLIRSGWTGALQVSLFRFIYRFTWLHANAVGILCSIREPKSMNVEIISKGFLQMPLKKFGSLVKYLFGILIPSSTQIPLNLFNAMLAHST